MNHFSALSPTLAVLVGLLALLGAICALIGSLGLLRLRTFYERVHPPTMGTTAGVGVRYAVTPLTTFNLDVMAGRDRFEFVHCGPGSVELADRDGDLHISGQEAGTT